MRLILIRSRGNFRGSHITTYGGLMTIRKDNIHAALTDLATRYPRAFVLEKYRPHRPLKVGVAADILARCPVLTRRELGGVLGVYARRVMYLQSLVAGRGPRRSRR